MKAVLLIMVCLALPNVRVMIMPVNEPAFD